MQQAHIVPFVPPTELCRGASVNNCGVRNAPINPFLQPHALNADAADAEGRFLSPSQTCAQYGLAMANRGPVAAFNQQRRSPFVQCDIVQRVRDVRPSTTMLRVRGVAINLCNAHKRPHHPQGSGALVPEHKINGASIDWPGQPRPGQPLPRRLCSASNRARRPRLPPLEATASVQLCIAPPDPPSHPCACFASAEYSHRLRDLWKTQCLAVRPQQRANCIASAGHRAALGRPVGRLLPQVVHMLRHKMQNCPPTCLLFSLSLRRLRRS